jgi:hypothetical protein
MSRNYRSRALALASGVALVASGFVAAPAVAAAVDVTLAPSTGLNYGSFANESFSLENNVTSLLNSTTTAYKITTDEEIVEVTLTQNTVQTTGVTILGFDALGNAVDLDGIDDTGDTSGSKVAGSNFTDTNATADSAGDSDDGLGQVAVTSGKFELDLAGNNLAGFVILKSSFQNTALDGQALSGSTQTETIIVQPLKTAGTGYVYGDGSPEPITIQSWIESEASADYSTVDTAYSSPVRTMTWVDPKGVSVIPTIERFVGAGTYYLNDDNDSNKVLAHSLRFIAAGLNLDQLDLTHWDYDVVQSDGTALSAGDEVDNNYANSDDALRDGFLSADAAGKIFIKVALNANLDHDDTYKVIVNHDEDTTAAVDFGSVGFTLPTSGVDYHIEATIDTSDDLAAQTVHTDLAVEVLSGTNARKFTAQIKSTDDTVAETASVPVMAIVTYASTYAPGTLTITGSSEVISAKAGYTMVNGFTDSDGKFALTVTSSTAVKSESYTVDFYVIAEQSAMQLWVNLDDAGATKDATPVVTYEDSNADGSSLAVTNSVLSGASVTASFTVTDQFGLGTSVDGTKAMQMELKATDTTDLKVYADVAADGSVSFTFANYLGAGESDVLTATLFTGTQLAQVSVDTALVTLYNASDVAAVQIPATVSTAITYDDFLSGGAATSAAAPAPNDGNVELKGTVVDANGAGIPGAPVTITGAGLQFVVDGGTKYYTDSITAVASAAGVFDVDVYSHIVNATGATITVTSGAASATTLLKTFLPAATAVNGNVLAFSMDMPANVVMNKTYAVTVTLTDKWGNPIQTNDTVAPLSALSIQGTGSVQINSSDTATTKNFGKDGKTTVFVRSVKDIAGPGAVVATLKAAEYTGGSLTGSDQALTITEITTDVLTTAWDETVFSNELSVSVEVAETEADLPAGSSAQKVNAGSFKGYVALYALGYEGQRLSAKVGNDWVIVPSIPAATNGLYRKVEFVGAGVDISVRIYIDRVLLTTIPLLTK